MALRIELWTDAGLVDGVEQWWDDVDAWLSSTDGAPASYPITASIDPYGFGAIPSADLEAFRSELAEIVKLAPVQVAAIATQLVSLCDRGLAATRPELRLVGD